MSVLAAADTAPPSSAAGDNATAPPAVEDFGYPGAEAITRVKLLHGDGGILLVDCAKPSQIQLWTRAPGNPGNKVCFAAPAATGWLTLQLPDLFAVQTAGRSVRAELTTAGATKSLDIPTNGFMGIGEGLGQAPATVVELRITG
ncbi:hypothetical protein ACFVHB_23400 [Kitasatospora sp. NPDC127111]|uniref:hypothetical protein n=1 Tax=Kitasatospora sp. NPDC127111 TaxID=3345363 RepID=UPI00363FF753